MSKKTTRSSAGSGTIRKREDGRWEARYTAGINPATGKQIQKSIYGKTQKEVREKLRKVTSEIDEGGYFEPSNMPLADWLDIWMKDYLKDVKPRTVDSYCSTARKHLKPALGRIRLKALTPVQVQVFINELFEGENGEGGLSAKTVHNIHGVLHRALQDAVSIGYLKYNVADNTKLPRKSKPEIHPMDKEDVARFLTAIQGNELETLFRTALFTGMRQGELLGLTWSRVDFVNGTITVSKQLQRKRDGSGEYELITPKNNKPRTLTPASDVMVRLHRLQTRQMEQRLMAGSAWENDQGFVFVNDLGRHLAAHTVYLKFKKVVEDMGMPDFRFHDLRHTFAVMSLQAGDDIKTLQENMGHHAASFTLETYAHSTASMKRESSERMDRLIQSVSGL